MHDFQGNIQNVGCVIHYARVRNYLDWSIVGNKLPTLREWNLSHKVFGHGVQIIKLQAVLAGQTRNRCPGQAGC
jgi:hypothetical protein